MQDSQCEPEQDNAAQMQSNLQQRQNQLLDLVPELDVDALIAEGLLVFRQNCKFYCAVYSLKLLAVGLTYFQLDQLPAHRSLVLAWLCLGAAFYCLSFIQHVWYFSRARSPGFKALVVKLLEERPHLLTLETNGSRMGEEISQMVQPTCLRCLSVVLNQGLLAWGVTLYMLGPLVNMGELVFWVWTFLLLEILLYAKFYILGAICLALLPFFLLFVLYNYLANRKKISNVQDALRPFKFGKRQLDVVSCPICMLNFASDSSVVTLRCSDQHTFHELCLRTWIAHKTDCPLCRQEIGAQQQERAEEERANIVEEPYAEIRSG